jgi:hypothetical protein
MKYCMFGAVKTVESAVGKSWVAIRHPARGVIFSVTGAALIFGANMNVAGMFM